jgi:type II secretory ATPase GspE/PulE/Tfp pilus assembly ATPase PilB-like protein
MRDQETVKIALSAAETGHLVLSTLHTINAGETINRILGMFEPEEQEQIRIRLADSLRWVVSQRLVPQIGGGVSRCSKSWAQPAHPGGHPPRRKRRQDLLRNHRGQLPVRLAHLRPGLPGSLRTGHHHRGNRPALLHQTQRGLARH